MIKYFVRTTGERILDESYGQIEYELLIDTEHNCGKAFLKQLDYVNNYDSVLLEDDCILCKNFKEIIEKVISKHPNDIINFFTFPNNYGEECYGIPRKFCYNQCTYFPKGLPKKIVSTFLDTGKKFNSAEKIMQIALNKLNLKYYIYRPCLVQHIDKGSLMKHNEGFSRRTPYFIDYLNELNIDYKDARKPENKARLIALMKEKFKN